MLLLSLVLVHVQVEEPNVDLAQLLTPKRCSSGQLYSEGARVTPSGTRRARDKLISVFSCNKGAFPTLFITPQSSPSQKREGRPCRPHEGCQDGLIVIR